MHIGSNCEVVYTITAIPPPFNFILKKLPRAFAAKLGVFLGRCMWHCFVMSFTAELFTRTPQGGDSFPH